MANPREFMLTVVSVKDHSMIGLIHSDDIPSFWLEFVDESHTIPLHVLPFTQEFEGTTWAGFAIAESVIEAEIAMSSVYDYLRELSTSGNMDLSDKNSPN